MEHEVPAETIQPKPSDLLRRTIAGRLADATSEEARHFRLAVSAGQIGSTLSAITRLGRERYRTDMQAAYRDTEHPNHRLACSLVESVVTDSGEEVFAWITSS